MPRGAGIQLIDWGKQENTERLLAAILAAQGMKVSFIMLPSLFFFIGEEFIVSFLRFRCDYYLPNVS